MPNLKEDVEQGSPDEKISLLSLFWWLTFPAINLLVLPVAIQRLQPHTYLRFLPKFYFQV